MYYIITLYGHRGMQSLMQGSWLGPFITDEDVKLFHIVRFSRLNKDAHRSTVGLEYAQS